MIQNCLLEKYLYVVIKTFIIRFLFSVSIEKNNIENRKFYFSAKLCAIQKKYQNTKLFQN